MGNLCYQVEDKQLQLDLQDNDDENLTIKAAGAL